MPSNPDPRVSIVVVGYAPAPLLARCLAVLSEQQARYPDAELLVVAHAEHKGTLLDPVRARFPAIPWIVAPVDHNVARLRGLGIARSRGAVVALLEGDCIPADDWLGRVAQLAPAVALGGAVEPGDFRRGLDWAAYFAEFSQFMAPLPERPAQLPGTNVAYRRAALPDTATLEGEGLYETFLNADLGARAALATDSALVVRHERTWRPADLLATRYHHGRGFGGLRVRGQPPVKRMAYLGLAVLLPFVLVARVLRNVGRRRRLIGRALASLPWIALLSASWSIGEFAGYAAGPGSSLEKWR